MLDNLAIRDLGVIAYLGVPLITTRNGHAVGTLCVIDHQPRIWTNDEISLIKDIAAAGITDHPPRQPPLHASQPTQQTAKRRLSAFDA
jgi:hypothetical protein